jgi:hypothetical protein
MKKFLAVFLVLAAGCLGSTDNNFFFSYDVQRLDAAPDTPPVVTIDNFISGAIEVRGGTSTPCYTDQLSLDGERQSETLAITITRQSSSTACTDTRVRHHRYSAIFSGLEPKTYQLRITDAIGATPTVVYDQPVVVK